MWTIDELVERVGAALTAEYPGAPNGRVRDVPDRRAVRWYATTGLVDRPSAMRGRTALYETRHLLQLVAVKRRQAEGRTLAEIQAELTGATESTLAEIARVPEDLLLTQPEPPTTAAPRARFWAAPVATADTATVPASAGVGPTPLAESAKAAVPETPAIALSGVALPGGVVLLVPGSPSPGDLADIAAAARPLLDLLSTRGLTTERDPS
ncbi:MerR family transcriptional regulator [Umezawaea sp. NPDC059074]|uniref:MerR family transcriptional regulator n=1 Tax=Umezawaea sp. NPDC059074 TaxID=3346716 RepID=UPI0036819643